AYGWPAEIADDDILARLVALNRERAEEEFRGKIRWLRPEFQAGIAAAPVQRELAVAAAAPAARQFWPRDLPDQFKAVRAILALEAAPAAADAIASRFVRARRDRVAAVLETLVSLGQARRAAPGRYAA
ncbi:MAG: class I SAM-dependent DNA methyltransferase, partial [Stellaceae bacterium]